jgi:hypothetical protein
MQKRPVIRPANLHRFYSSYFSSLNLAADFPLDVLSHLVLSQDGMWPKKDGHATPELRFSAEKDRLI